MNLAYPKAPAEVKETVALEQCLDAILNSDMKIRIKQVRPKDLNDSIRHAVEFGAYLRAEEQCNHKAYQRQVTGTVAENSVDKELKQWMESVEKNMLILIKEIKQIQLHARSNDDNETKQSFRWRRDLGEVECFYCHQKGHYQRFCPEAKFAESGPITKRKTP